MFPEGVFSLFQDAIQIRSHHSYYYSIRFPYGEELWCEYVYTVEIAAQWDAIITTRNKIVLLIIYILGRSGTTSRGFRPVPPSRRYVIVCSMAVLTRTAIGRSWRGGGKTADSHSIPVRVYSRIHVTGRRRRRCLDESSPWTSSPLFSSTYTHTCRI